MTNQLQNLIYQYKDQINSLERSQKALQEKVKALEEMHAALLFLKEVKEKYPSSKSIIAQKKVVEIEVPVTEENIGNQKFEPSKTKRKYVLKINQRKDIPYNELQENLEAIKEQLKSYYNASWRLSDRTLGHIAEAIIYLYHRGNSEKNRLKLELSFANKVLSRTVFPLKKEGLIESFQMQGSQHYKLTEAGIRLINKVVGLNWICPVKFD